MGFDIDAFRKASLNPRTYEVELPELKNWFPADAEPVFLVRGLSGEQFHRVRESLAKRRDIQNIADKLLSGSGEAFSEAFDLFFGGLPDEYVKVIEALEHGCVDPKLEREDALKLVKHFPVFMDKVFKQIMLATGEGSLPGE